MRRPTVGTVIDSIVRELQQSDDGKNGVLLVLQTLLEYRDIQDILYDARRLLHTESFVLMIELLQIQCNQAWNTACETARKSLVVCEREKKKSTRDNYQTQICLAWGEAFDTFELRVGYILEAVQEHVKDQDTPSDSLETFSVALQSNFDGISRKNILFHQDEKKFIEMLENTVFGRGVVRELFDARLKRESAAWPQASRPHLSRWPRTRIPLPSGVPFHDPSADGSQQGARSLQEARR